MADLGPSASKSQNQPNGHPPLSHQQSLPMGASAASLKDARADSALPSVTGLDHLDDEDDTATVGRGRRERSASSSSQSAQSGLDLLWRAAQDPRTLAYYEQEHKNKRKANHEHVAEWRQSGIPQGVDSSKAADRRRAAAQAAATNPAAPPKKRRKSDMQIDAVPIDPSLLDSPNGASSDDGVFEEVASDYQSPSAEEAGSDDEYGTSRRGRPKSAGRLLKRGVAKGRGKGIPHIPGVKKVAKKSETSPSGASAKSRRLSASAPAGVGTVQCEYVNPLPVSITSFAHPSLMLQPYNRCQEMFTRKYDLPRHMARHGRQEGELVKQGILDDDKAIYWRAVRDAPKVVCEDCGEEFTRTDALRRHQAKQHH